MRLLFRVVFVAILVLTPLPAMAAQVVTVSELVALSPDLSGEEVIVEGELVGDYGSRGGYVWTQLNGDMYVTEPIREGGSPAGGNVGVGVRIPADMAQGLDHPGGYHHRGPVVQLSGVWRHHDPSRGGESFLDVESLAVVESGRLLDEGIEWWTVIGGGGLLAVAGVIWLGRRKEQDH
ncbi:MAG: hypothetical protein PVF87_02215 [Acidimicrobiia bacterium]|jgi:hypothetical protein